MTARARAFVALGAHLCLAAHLAGLLHVVLVRHATCPSHGEMVHGDVIAVSAAPAGDDSRRSVSDHPVKGPEEPDDHCLYLATRRQDLAALSPGSTSAILPASAVAPSAPAPAHAFVDPSALLRLAPKTSPPAAA